MTDIVERLGRYGNLEPCLGADIAAAKAEIERLRTEVEAWRKQYPHAGFDGARIVTPVGSEIVRMMERVIENAQAQPQENDG